MGVMNSRPGHKNLINHHGHYRLNSLTAGNMFYTRGHQFRALTISDTPGASVLDKAINLLFLIYDHSPNTKWTDTTGIVFKLMDRYSRSGFQTKGQA